jgi:hypothetical protein
MINCKILKIKFVGITKILSDYAIFTAELNTVKIQKLLKNIRRQQACAHYKVQ